MARWKKDGRTGGLISRGRETPWRFYEESKKLDFFARAGTVTTPLLIVQGSEDTTVPMEDILKLRDAWAGTSELIRVEGGDHSLGDPFHTELFVALCGSWFSHHLR